MPSIRYQRLLPAADSTPLLRLYQRSVSAVDDHFYSAAQRTAWAHWATDVARADSQIRRGLTLVALANNNEVGFAQLFPGELVNMLYVDSGWQGRGIGKELVSQLETVARYHGVRTLFTRASGVSHSLFAALGFESIQSEQVWTSEGITLSRTLMRKTLTPLGPSAAERLSVDDDGAADRPVITR